MSADVFYGIAYPADTENVVELPKVLQDRTEVLNVMKKHKTARFKRFPTQEEALEFSQSTDQAHDEHDAGDGVDAKVVPSEGSAFKGLKPQELVKLRKAIERGDEDYFEEKVWENPRYLISASDTPTILHEGSRSNALHVAAKGQLDMVLNILDLLQDPDFFALMYPNDSPESRANRQEYLMDLYLNMPDKGHNDTPLHHASKFGHLDIVRALAQFSACDTRRRNKHGETPEEVACTRSSTGDVDLKNRIVDELADKVYIPVFRALDLSVTPYIGEPWSPRKPTAFVENGDGDSALNHVLTAPRSPVRSPRSPMLPARSMRSPMRSPGVRSPLVRSPLHSPGSPLLLPPASPLSSPVSVQAVLGPVSPHDVDRIQSEWKRSTTRKQRLDDPFKCYEKQGRIIAEKYKVGWKEYWEFLDEYVDLRTAEGLAMLENHLARMTEDARQRDLEDRIKDFDSSFGGPVDQPDGPVDRVDPLSPVSALCLDFESRLTFQDDPSFDDPSFDGSDGESFRTAASSPVTSSTSSSPSLFTADEFSRQFMEGPTPTAVDRQVFAVIQREAVSSREYPLLGQWMDLMRSYSVEERKDWTSGRKRIKVPKINLDISQ